MKQLITILLVIFPISGFAQTQTQWDVSLWGQRRAFTEHIEKLAELVEIKTNGDFVLNLSYGGLATPGDNLDSIAGGAFEMAQICAGFHADKTPSLTVLELPYLGVSTLEEERTVSQDLLRQPAVLTELARYNALALMPTPLPQQNLAGIGDRPNTLSDLAGQRIRATAGTAEAMEALGASPTRILATDVRDALGTGKINAAAFAPHEHMSFGTIANATWWIGNLNPGTVNCPVIANIESISNLPPQHREALYSSINESLDYYVQNYQYNLSQSWEPVLDELNVEKIYFDEAELDVFRLEAAAAAARKWIQENTARGVDAQTLYESVVTTVYGGNIQNVPDSLPVFTEQKKRQQILDSYAFNRVPGQQTPEPLPEPEPARTFSFDKKPQEQQVEQLEEELPVAATFPIEVPKSNTKIENIADVTVAALPASADGPMFFTGDKTAPQAPAAPTKAPPLATPRATKVSRAKNRVENIADVTVAALPASAAGPMFFSGNRSNQPPAQEIAAEETATELTGNGPAPDSLPAQGADFYFGPPRNGAAKNLSANPMDVAVEWDLDSYATVGGTLQQLARYIGYELVDSNLDVGVLSRRLPTVHRKVESISVADGFKIISGKGLLTVFNHVDRTVTHLPQKANPDNNVSLPVCPNDITLASFSRDGVLKLSDGSECLFQ